MCSGSTSTPSGRPCNRTERDLDLHTRVTSTSSGAYRIWLRPNEVALLRDLVAQLRDRLLASTDEPMVRRLFPPAYANDAERDAGYQVLTRDELLEGKLQALTAVEEMLESTPEEPASEDADAASGEEAGEGLTLEADEPKLAAWMRALNDLRLVLGTLLDVEEDMELPSPDDPQAALFAVYEFLGWLLAQIVEALDQP